MCVCVRKGREGCELGEAGRVWVLVVDVGGCVCTCVGMDVEVCVFVWMLCVFMFVGVNVDVDVCGVVNCVCGC